MGARMMQVAEMAESLIDGGECERATQLLDDPTLSNRERDRLVALLRRKKLALAPVDTSDPAWVFHVGTCPYQD